MAKSKSPDSFRDPVCGMDVKPDGPYRTIYENVEYLFCSRHCLEKFNEGPARFSKSSGQWTCPMHSEFRQPGPGKCPRCGMALEPAAPPAPLTKTEWLPGLH